VISSEGMFKTYVLGFFDAPGQVQLSSFMSFGQKIQEPLSQPRQAWGPQHPMLDQTTMMQQWASHQFYARHPVSPMGLPNDGRRYAQNTALMLRGFSFVEY